VGYVPAGAPDYLAAEPVAQPGRAVLTVSVAEEHLPSLHETHIVDTASGSLRDRAGRTERATQRDARSR
jgi:hypothetical protein